MDIKQLQDRIVAKRAERGFVTDPVIRKILFGTGSDAKIELVRAYLKDLPVLVLSPKDLNIDIDVQEDGRTPLENAAKKAKAYYAAAAVAEAAVAEAASAADGIPTFAIDAGLRIEKFPEESQPGVYVNRVTRDGRKASDEEILDYYREGLEAVGGTSPGRWTIAVSFVTSVERVHTQQFQLETLFTSQASQILLPGAPLSSLMKDPGTGRYYSEMEHAERPDSVLIAEIIHQQIEQL